MSTKISISVVLIALFTFAFTSCRMDEASLKRAIELHTMLNDAEYVGMETCAMCHEAEVKEFSRSAHANMSINLQVEGRDVAVQGCEMCHGPGSIHVDQGGGKGTMINPSEDPSICFACHTDKKAQFHLPFRHPVLEGHMSCASCHDPHGPDIVANATSMESINETCFNCHKEQRGPFVWEHEAMREGCTSCHDPHGSITDKMLLARDSNLCLRCHTQTNFPTIGDRDHGSNSNMARGSCFSAACHTAVHGSQFNEHLRY